MLRAVRERLPDVDVLIAHLAGTRVLGGRCTVECGETVPSG